MYQEISQLLMYGDLDEDSILAQMGEVFGKYETGEYNKTGLVRDINTQVKRILKVATDYGFDDNLWHNYLTFFLMMSENPFSMTCEKVGASDGSVNELVENDFRIFKELFDYDFGPIEKDLGINCFSQISNYKAIHKKDLMYNKNVSEKVRSLSKKLEAAKDEKEFFDAVTGFYKDYGVGMFGLNKAFRIDDTPQGSFTFRAINNMDTVMLDDLVGYEIQKKKLVDNTEAFVQGKKANNVLLFGDSGTGKSTSIKAIVNQYYKDGLRMIEIYKHQFKYLSEIIAEIKNRNYRFIIYMDDLSFEEFEIEYKFLKAVIEGGVDNSNDRHHSDTVEEKLSLVNRFGVTINYSKPTQKEYFDIVLHLARRAGVTLPDEQLRAEANKWELSHGGISGRTAEQFVSYLASQPDAFK